MNTVLGYFSSSTTQLDLFMHIIIYATANLFFAVNLFLCEFRKQLNVRTHSTRILAHNSSMSSSTNSNCSSCDIMVFMWLGLGLGLG